MLKKFLVSSSLITTFFFAIIIIGVLMILNFFGIKITVSTVENNYLYADSYLNSLNLYIKDGYVPLSRIIYFYLADESKTIEDLYLLNQDSKNKSLKNIALVCNDEELKNSVVCSQTNINENINMLELPEQYFNFPLKDKNYMVTSFFNEKRFVYEKSNVHNGWDFATNEKTPIYSVCNGIVTNINFTQNENIPYDESNNNVGNNITIACDDYGDIYYVIFRHLYPSSNKVRVGDRVKHWTEIASVGTTGYSTGNHLHYEVLDKDNNLIDGMSLVDLTLTYTN